MHAGLVFNKTKGEFGSARFDSKRLSKRSELNSPPFGNYHPLRLTLEWLELLSNACGE